MRKESAIRDVTKKDAGNIAIKSPAALRLRGPEAYRRPGKAEPPPGKT
jgi:hypothetical protein